MPFLSFKAVTDLETSRVDSQGLGEAPTALVSQGLAHIFSKGLDGKYFTSYGLRQNRRYYIGTFT